MKDLLTFEELSQHYPDEWILVGNPEFENTHLKQGIFIAHSKDYLELCYQSQELTKNVPDSTIVFTGETKNKNRKWLRAIRLTEKSKTT